MVEDADFETSDDDMIDTYNSDISNFEDVEDSFIKLNNKEFIRFEDGKNEIHVILAQSGISYQIKDSRKARYRLGCLDVNCNFFIKLNLKKSKNIFVCRANAHSCNLAANTYNIKSILFIF